MANDTTVSRYLPDGRGYLNIDTNKSLVVADSGIVQNVIADAITLTLPTSAAATVGARFIARNGGAATATGGPVGATSSGSVLVTLAPVAADGFTGNGVTPAVNKAMLNTKATSGVGNEIRVSGSGLTGANAWYVETTTGIWARAA